MRSSDAHETQCLLYIALCNKHHKDLPFAHVLWLCVSHPAQNEARRTALTALTGRPS
jgi:hypothetical protein